LHAIGVITVLVAMQVNFTRFSNHCRC
jgi:hypothetical protein